MNANQETTRQGLDVIPFCRMGSAKIAMEILGAIKKQNESRSVRSFPRLLFSGPNWPPGT